MTRFIPQKAGRRSGMQPLSANAVAKYAVSAARQSGKAIKIDIMTAAVVGATSQFKGGITRYPVSVKVEGASKDAKPPANLRSTPRPR